ncbi:MAG TPA: DNA-3-methyladenine glycosylase [Acidimicrobiales bacterium]|nr:DNA-3-methyladenine glycosylase [Acidimicrobiales bacterium]
MTGAGPPGRAGAAGPAGAVLARDFYRRPSLEVAPDLLNKVLVRGSRSGRIVEVEAYCGADDPASHAFRGRTARNATMFGPPGHLYVYFTYGMHFCANVVCGEEGEAGAVLLRGLTPMSGLEEMRAARPTARRDRDLCAGPARLCLALGIDRAFDGADLVTSDAGVQVADDGVAPPAVPAASGRIGLKVAADRPWRLYVPGAPGLSRPG